MKTEMRIEIDLMLPVGQLVDIFKRMVISNLCAEFPVKEQNRLCHWARGRNSDELDSALAHIQRSVRDLHLND